ncbi:MULTISPECIES: DUF6527 family protein [Sphingomonadales]|uniref:DUF6527 family protein n=1 Tax=Novosphingobium sp. SCN 63-17 TaxID=1660120 RepID=UPI00345935A4
MHSTALKLKSVVSSRAAVDLHLASPGDAVLILRGEPRWLLIQCPCGCGEEIPINLDSRAGKAWRIYGISNRQLTLFPSVWRDTGCRSHFIVWRDKVMWCGGWRSQGSVAPTVPDFATLVQEVEASWPHEGWTSFVTIADALGQIPYDVQEACHHLTREGFLIEGIGDLRGHFRRR